MSDTETVAPAMADPMDSFDITADDLAETSGTDQYDIGGPPPDPVPATPEPEAKAPEVEAPSSSQEAAPLPDGYKRDSMGRIHGPDGRVISKEEAAKLTTPAVLPTGVETTEAPKPEKFRYRSAGQTKELEGFEYDPATGRVSVAPEHVGLLRDAMNARDVLAEGRDINESLRAENAQLRQSMEQVQQQGTIEGQKAKALVDAYSQILAEPDEAKAIESFFRLRADYPSLLSKAEAQYWRLQAEARARQPQTPAQRQPEPTRPTSALPPREIALQTTQEYVEQLKLDHAFRDLTPEHWKQFEAAVQRTPYRYLRPATAEDAQTFGVTEGETVFDTDAFGADFTEYATTLRSARETAEKRAKLAADNARRTAPSIDAPPVPGGGAAPAKAARAIKSKQDLEDWLDSDEL